MQDDKTIIKPSAPRKAANADSDRTVLYQLGIRVSVVDSDGKISKELFFAHGFSAGRAQDNDIVIHHSQVSRHHLQVKKQQNDWWVYNLNSVNGIYIQNQFIERAIKLQLPVSIALGKAAVFLKIQDASDNEVDATQATKSSVVFTDNVAARSKSPQGNLSKEAIKARLLSQNEAEDAGDFTRMIRHLIKEDRTSRGKNYQKWISLLGVLFILSAGLIAYQQAALSNARKLAIDMFYDIKTLEVSMSQSEITIEKSADILAQALKAVTQEKLTTEVERIKAEQEKITKESLRLTQERIRLNSMKTKYQTYVQEAKSLRFRLPFGSHYEEELIAKVAREFGESELEVPDGFMTEVRRYIGYWQHSTRMRNAMATLEQNNYASTIINALNKEGLPLSFIYLPLQESSYNTLAIGPETRYGIAKGAWQFLSSTGTDYGLTPGPLANVRAYDAQDDRFNFDKASLAGAKYLKYIYSTEAQASGLLVMASYNYGHNRVKSMIKKMPDNPRDRNFWKFIKQYQLPKETYDYVFYIFSAAVIGEDPKHFGFTFKPAYALN